AVLPLHSAELMAVLFAVLLFHPWPLLVGYWFGAAMHLTFDVLVNGDYALKRAFLFYVFSYRAYHGFAASELLEDKSGPDSAGERPVLEFFQWRPAVESRTENTHPGREAASDSESLPVQ